MHNTHWHRAISACEELSHIILRRGNIILLLSFIYENNNDYLQEVFGDKMFFLNKGFAQYKVMYSDDKREYWVDCLRAIAIILVLVGHLLAGCIPFYIFTSPIKIPLFFAITGYVFKDRDGDVKLFFKKIVRNIVIPWICLAFPIYFLPHIISLNAYQLSVNLKLFLSGGILWYMPCCIFAEIIHFCVRKFFCETYKCLMVSVLLTCIGFALAKYNLLNFGNINTAFIVQSFMMIGFLWKNEKRICVFFQKRGTVFICVGIYILLGCFSLVKFSNQYIDVHLNTYYNLFVCYLMIFVGCFVLFAFFSKYNIHNFVLTFCGRNTLFFYFYFDYFVGALNGLFTSEVLKIVFCFLLCGAIALILDIFSVCVVKRKEK